MIKKNSVKANYIYNLIYNLLGILLPLITTPYISRILGAENIGIFGYTSSIVMYFILFGTLGTNLYGQREIAYTQNNIKKQSKVFYEIVIIRIIAIIISLTCFSLCFCIKGEYAIYYQILMLYVIASAFDISWYLQGIFSL